jgi:CO/xanthine dehydrogenase FAD-binding subunit
MNKVKIIRVTRLEEIDRFLAKDGRPVAYLAGGTDMMVYGRRDESPAPVWLDISPLEELRFIKELDNSITIGALTTIREIAESPLVREFLPCLHQAACMVGSPLIRNRATIGGNFGNASPAGDTIPPLYAHEARIILHPKTPKDSLKVNNFFTGPKTTILQRGELITAFEIPKRSGITGFYAKLGQRNSLRIAKVSMAMSLRVTARGLEDVRIALGAVGPTVYRAFRTEAILEGRLLNADVIREAEQEIREECMPIDDIRSTADYRREMLPVLLERFLVEDLAPRFRT